MQYDERDGGGVCKFLSAWPAETGAPDFTYPSPLIFYDPCPIPTVRIREAQSADD